MLNQHQTIRDNIARYNKLNPLADFLIPFIGDKKTVRILDIGSGPYSTIGNYLDGVTVELDLADNQDFTSFWKQYIATPLFPVNYQDMEQLTYPNDQFDIVTCINALDHTNNAVRALGEMIRVCKPGGYVYIDCHLDQADTGHKHKWDAKENGRFESGVNNPFLNFSLEDYGFKVEYIDNGGERRYNKIIATLQKA